jgi:hypothetical protein
MFRIVKNGWKIKNRKWVIGDWRFQVHMIWHGHASPIHLATLSHPQIYTSCKSSPSLHYRRRDTANEITMPAVNTTNANPAPRRINEGVSLLLAGVALLTAIGVGSGVSSGSRMAVACALGGTGVNVGNGFTADASTARDKVTTPNSR